MKYLFRLFILAMLFAYTTSFLLLNNRDSLTPTGIEENYIGNEENTEASILKFKKSSFEVLGTIHTHVFTLSLIFIVTGILTYFTNLPTKLKLYLIAEPFVSMFITFSSLILVWRGLGIFKYLAFISGAIMHMTFIATILILLWHLYKKPSTTTSS
ncbi:MAG: hypothetical protein ABFS32_02930 [Bacteroidota bacterium]